MLLFNRQVQGIMPVLDCKPVRQDCDDDHHSKLIDRQHKNDNDTPTVFPYIPIVSAVVVQQEDSGPCTPGMVIDIGNHNHHSRSYTIQLTTNGRCITQNRSHIKPTTVTADAYLQHQSNKQSNITTDLLADLLNNINKNPAAYNNKQSLNSVTGVEQSNRKINNKSLQQEVENIEQSTNKTGINKVKGTDVSRRNVPTTHKCEVTRTRSGHIIKKTRQINIHLTRVVSPANLLVVPTNVIWLAALSHNSKCLFV